MTAPYSPRTAFWRASDLEALRADRLAGLSLVECALRQGGDIHSADCDLALWALLGRTAQEAAVHLNFRAAA